MMIFTFFTLKDLSLIINLTKFFAWKNIKTCLRGKIEGLIKEADIIIRLTLHLVLAGTVPFFRPCHGVPLG